MASDVEICNRALHKLGADTIIALTDDNNRARVMNVAYQPVRDAELFRRRWKFSIKRASLPALSSTPAFGYAYQYQVPTDFLRLIEGGDLMSNVDLSDYRGGGATYAREGDKILTNYEAPIDVRYIARITDTSLFDPAFAEALSARLAMECCKRITDSDTAKAAAQADYRLAIREAIVANAIERAAESMADDSWMMARQG